MSQIVLFPYAVLNSPSILSAEEQELDRPTPSSRVLSKRKMAFISPRLGVLNNIPFAIPFSVRVQIFRQFIANDAHRLGLDDWYARPKHKATIRRSSVAQDGFDQLGSLGAALKDKISITFVDAFGNEEAGIDGGTLLNTYLVVCP
jgi:ubiquitin-protein ligase E3 C